MKEKARTVDIAARAMLLAEKKVSQCSSFAFFGHKEERKKRHADVRLLFFLAFFTMQHLYIDRGKKQVSSFSV